MSRDLICVILVCLRLPKDPTPLPHPLCVPCRVIPVLRVLLEHRDSKVHQDSLVTLATQGTVVIREDL